MRDRNYEHRLVTSEININKRTSLACAARLEDTLCPPETPFERLGLPLIHYRGDNISKYVCPTVIIEIT